MKTDILSRDKNAFSKNNENLPPNAQIIVDPVSGKRYIKGNFLGKGGFAKCYEVVDSDTNEAFACKIVSKSQLVKQHQRDKMTSEIAIHRELNHQNIVKFHKNFEDGENVYILLEICRKRTLLELHKRRKALTDPEVRYYMHQIAISCKYMHDNCVIHRDLKLGNLFLDEDLQVKVGDFGLAAKIEFTGERKKTLCGTPNYIAPEILNKKGHSYEVDIWSIGCIIYTLYVGTPPFETSNVKETYTRIKNNRYTIPSKVPKSAQLLIVKLLQSDPTKRPNINQILDDSYFTSGYLPTHLPQSSLTVPPRFPTQRVSVATPIKPVIANNLQAKNIGNGETVNMVERSHAIRVCDSGMSSYDDGGDEPDNIEPRDCYLTELYDQVTKCLNKHPHRYNNIQQDEAEDPAATPFYWISKWVDYSAKYGIGYQLNDGSFGVLFNDCTRIISTSDKQMFTYINADGVESFVTVDNYDPALKKKVSLLLHFHEYMHTNLIDTGKDIVPTKCTDMVRLPTLRMWIRETKDIVFLLSCGILQVNFFADHCKIILCPRMASVTFIDERRRSHTYPFALIEKYGCSIDLIKRLKSVRASVKVLIDNSKPNNVEVPV